VAAAERRGRRRAQGTDLPETRSVRQRRRLLLTAREREVALLAAAGQSGPLGIHGREQLAGLFADQI
jgi:hypothetical protein